MVTVTLSKAQAGWVEWALPAVEQYLTERVAEGELTALPPLPKLEGCTLRLEPDTEVLADLQYRLVDMAPDVAVGADTLQAEVGGARCAARAWERISLAVVAAMKKS
jgi:hypothetical protein